MTKDQIINIINDVFGSPNDLRCYKIHSNFTKIEVGGITFYCYGDSSKESIWYVNFYYFNGAFERQILIPKNIEREFISQVLLITKRYETLNQQFEILKDDVKNLNNKDSIRDIKIKSLLDVENHL